MLRHSRRFPAPPLPSRSEDTPTLHAWSRIPTTSSAEPRPTRQVEFLSRNFGFQYEMKRTTKNRPSQNLPHGPTLAGSATADRGVFQRAHSFPIRNHFCHQKMWPPSYSRITTSGERLRVLRLPYSQVENLDPRLKPTRPRLVSDHRRQSTQVSATVFV